METTVSSLITSLSTLRTETGSKPTPGSTLIEAQYRGKLATQENVDLWNELRQDLGLTEQAMAELFDQKYTDYFEDQASATAEATDAAVDHTDALQAEADAMGAAADAAQEAADAQRATVDSVYALETCTGRLERCPGDVSRGRRRIRGRLSRSHPFACVTS